MNTENWVEELCAIAFSDVGDLVDDHGKPIPMSDLPRHVRRHLGLLDRDNTQKAMPVLVKVELVG